MERGHCIEGVCVYNEGMVEKSEWINLDGRDCQSGTFYDKLNACTLLVFCFYSGVNCIRLIRKTYVSSKESQRNIRSQLKKP